jgi:hypothetical protein
VKSKEQKAKSKRRKLSALKAFLLQFSYRRSLFVAKSIVASFVAVPFSLPNQ